jgi:hypothetical protein
MQANAAAKTIAPRTFQYMVVSLATRSRMAVNYLLSDSQKMGYRLFREPVA